MERWRGRVAVVTGASEGIGEAIARRLAGHGLRVVALARRQHLLDALESELREEGRDVKGLSCDVGSRDEVFNVFQMIEEEVGPISILVNNAGLLLPTVMNPEMDLDNAQKMLDCNIMGVLNCTKAALTSMRRNNIDDGHIVNISSLVAHIDSSYYPELAAYFASKTGLNVITKTLKYQLAIDNTRIRASTVSPGMVDTALIKEYTEGDGPRPRTLHPDDVVDSVEFVIAAPDHINIREVIVEPC